MISPTLFIDDATEIFLPISRRGSNEVGATVSFEVWTDRTAGTQVGTEHAMAWDATVGKYAGIFPADEADGLSETLTGGPFYWLRITASGYTTRYIKCIAKYRGAS